jgi:hypothetical protein
VPLAPKPLAVKEAPKPQKSPTSVSVPPKPIEIRAAKPNGAAVAPPPAAKPVVQPAKSQPATALFPITLADCLDEIAQQLGAQQGKPVSGVTLGETKLPLAKWEIAAFARTGDDVATGIQRAVAARSLLVIAVEQFKKKPGFDLQAIITTAKTESVKLEQAVLQAKQNKNIEGAVNLAASGKQLGMLIAKAQQLLK